MNNITLNINSSLEEMEKFQSEIHNLLCSTSDESIINSLYKHQNNFNTTKKEKEKEKFKISEKDKEDLLETTKDLMIDYVETETLTYAKQSFHEDMLNNVGLLLEEQLNTLYEEDTLEEYEVNKLIDECLKKAYRYVYSYVSPRRSYDGTGVRKPPNPEKMTIKINELKNKPQPDQRTNEWYEFRYNLLTASSIWKAFKSESTRNQLIYEKCKPLDLSKYNGGVYTNSPLHWGQKYEELSVMFYEKQFNTKVEDFGCIPHDDYYFLGASPDGIIVDDESPIYGRMLEIKNIVNRKITGIPKYEYWIQMQIQMEVCDLNECDFLETRFIEYENEDEFNEDGTFNETKNGEPKGIMMYFIRDGKTHYEYAPLFCTKPAFLKWEEETMKKNSDAMWMKNIYWRLDQLSCVLVLRNKLWFSKAVPLLDKVWKDIEHDRVNGYEHRAPKKRNSASRKRKKSAITQDNTDFKKECLLDAMSVMDIELMDNDNPDNDDNMNQHFSKDNVKTVHEESKYDTRELHKKYYDLSHNIIKEHIKKIQEDIEQEEETNKKNMKQTIQTTPLLNFSEKNFKSLSDDDIEFHLDDNNDDTNHK